MESDRLGDDSTPAASNARTIFDSDSVGGADDSRNGFWNLMPVNVVDRSVPMVLPGLG
jgi:hypothetical protein